MTGINKRWTGRATAVIALTATVALASTGLAFADDIGNSLDGSIDAVYEVMPLNAGGPNGTTTLYVAPAGGDGKNGCNLTGSTTLGLSVSSSNTAVATVSPSAVTFESCGDVKTLTVTPVSGGSATVSVAQTSNTTDGTFNLTGATFTVNVAPAAVTNTAPRISVTNVTGGASYNKGSVPAATCQVTDAEDGNSSFAATLSAVTGPNAADGIGAQTASCSYTDRGGMTASASEEYSIVDPSAPLITYTLTPAAPTGAEGWYTGEVSLSWNVSDLQSPNSLQKTGCVDQTITADQAATDYSCSATSAGGSAEQQTVSLKRDGTAPTVSYASASGTLGANGWYTSDVAVTFTATDATSGPATASQTVTSSGQGDAVVVNSPAFTDAAGNTTAAGVVSKSYKIDESAPNAPTASLSPAPNGAGWNKNDVLVSFTADGDNGPSGIDQCTADVSVNTETAGQTVTGTCTDKAGNLSAETTVTVKLDKTGPAVSNAVTVSGTAGTNGWYTSDVDVTFTATDALSGPASATKMVTSSGEGNDVTVESPAFTDAAGNTTAAGAVSKSYKIDKSAPNAPTASLNPAANAAGWNKNDVVVSFTANGDNGPSGVASCTADVPVTVETSSQTVSGTCTDNAGNVSSATTVTVKLDKTGPSIGHSLSPSAPNANGWYKTDVTVDFTCTDTRSGIHTCTGDTTLGEGENQSVTGTATDNAGNTNTDIVSNIDIDKTAPSTPTFSGGPGSSYYFGNNPAAPTCSSSDALSGLQSCVVTGGGSSVGPHTYTATATDNAGNTSTARLDYTVLAWTTKGFYSPVDMGGVWNTVKGGSTVPLKFELFAGSTELTSVDAVQSFTAQKISCTSGSGEDVIEFVTTGGTSLRYDSTGGQFIQNWKTPTGAGLCYSATMTADDGSSITALFKIK